MSEATTKPIDAFLKALENVNGESPTRTKDGINDDGTGNGAEYRGLCTCGGSRDNLWIRETSFGFYRLHCHRRECPPSEILEALSLPFKKHFPIGANQLDGRRKIDGKTVHDSSSGAIAATSWSLNKSGFISRPDIQPSDIWNYENEDGEIVFKVLRYDTDNAKEYRQISRSEEGWGCCAMPDSRPLYRLPNLLTAKGIVYICEGEKACDAALSLGLNATSPSQGSSSPHKTDWSSLNHFNKVVFLPDRDAAGKKFAELGLWLLAEQAPSPDVAVIHLWDDLTTLENGGDAYDWIEHFDSTPPKILVERLQALTNHRHEYSAKNTKKSGLKKQSNKTVDSTLRVLKNFSGSEEDAEPSTIASIAAMLNTLSDGFPIVCNGRLVVYNPTKDVVTTFVNISQLFAWIGSISTSPPKFITCPGYHPKSEVFEYLISSQTQYDSIETLPHEPPIDGHYYAHKGLPTPNGEHLKWLVNRFSVATDVDRGLILSLLLTVFWGGPAGDRPIFLITADGQGAGKTTLAKVVSSIAGGSTDVQSNEKTKELKERLLSPEGRANRLVLLDNQKGWRTSNPDQEALITCSEISGREMYKGESSRPNYLTWIYTGNSPNLSRDLAQRVVPIKLKRAKYSASWSSDTFAYIKEHRCEIIADIVVLLQAERQTLQAFSRWASWESGVLARVPGMDASVAQQTIKDRQSEIDCDEGESEDIEDFIQTKLVDLSYPPEADVFISNTVMQLWYSSLIGQKCGITKASRAVNTNINNGLISRLQSHRTKSERGFIWVGSGDKCNILDAHFDLSDRLDRQQGNGPWPR